jgi:hypothetical protein
MSSTSHKEFKFFKVALFLDLSSCILTIKGQYFAKVCFVRENIEIWQFLFFNVDYNNKFLKFQDFFRIVRKENI